MVPADVEVFMQRSNDDICNSVSKLVCPKERALHAQDAVAQAAFLADRLKKQATEEAKHVLTREKNKC